MRILRSQLKISPSSGGGGGALWRGHEPGGMTLISEHPFSTKNNSPSSPLWDTFGSAALTLESDPTAPQSPSSVLRCTYPINFTAGGQTPGFIGLDISAGAQRYLYFAYWVQYSSNFFGHSTGINKISYCWVTESGGFTPFVMESEGSGSNTLAPHVILQNMVGAGDGHYNNTLSPTNNFTRGQWHLVEGLLQGNTAGTSDGRFDIWINGLASITGTGLQWTSGATAWMVFEYQPVWGGVDNDPAHNVPAEMFIQWDHCYLSRKA